MLLVSSSVTTKYHRFVLNMAEFTGRETKELQAHVEKYGVSKIGEYVSSKLDDWRNVVIHFAVCGVSGSGKSTFINRMRG